MRACNNSGGTATAIAALAVCIGVAGVAIDRTGLAQTATEQTGYSASDAAAGPIDAPTTADPGQAVDIAVEGAPDGARIELWGPVGEAGEGSRLAQVPLTGGVATLTAPEMPGSYRLRYVDAAGNERARRAFDVAAVPIALTVTTPVGAGAALDVRWQGPARPGDRFEIASASGAVVASIPVAGDPSAGNVSRLTAPEVPGAYELRYVTAGGAVLRRVGFDVR